MTEQVDPHSPTTAGPEPTPVIGVTEATTERPAGSALPPGGGPAERAVDPHPEKQVGLAFAGGLGVAIVLKILANRKHR